MEWSTILPFLGGLISTVVGVLLGRATRLGAVDHAVHQKRLDLYPILVQIGQPLAVYFPVPADTSRLDAEDAPVVDPACCAAMGKAMSKWYFDGGGLLLSSRSRDAYFRLATALTRASVAGTLASPRMSDYPALVSVEKIGKYRAEMPIRFDRGNVDNWQFGEGSGKQTRSVQFKDYIFLQELSSALRSELARDLRGRRRPS